MKVVETHEITDHDEMTTSLKIEIDGDLSFYVSDGEPEDNNLYRNFSSCYAIGHLLQKAYDAGKAGEEFDHIIIDKDE